MGYSKRVHARGELAKRLKGKLERAKAEGIVEEDLDAIAAAADDAREADREQKAQLAEDDADRSGRADATDDVLARGDKLRNRMPAVIQSLTEQGHVADARFATALSYARFRMRNLPPVDPELAENPDVKRVEAVEREDKLTLLSGLANLTKTLLGRPTIVAELTRRGLDEAALTQLQADAEAGWAAGKNQRQAAEATRRESDACKRQKAKWDANRAMIRDAVKGDPELEALYAEC